jgi:succinoglycan biosynthesis transport protein ExoP
MIRSAFGLVSNLFGPVAPEITRSESELIRTASRSVMRNLTARRVGLTYIVEVSFRSPNPSRAAGIANAVVDAYIFDQLESKYQTTRRASVWLQERIKDLRAQASEAERQVLDFKEQNNIVDTGGRSMNTQQLSEINTQLTAARAQTAEAKARYERIEEVKNLDVADAAVTDSLKNEVINRLRNQYLDLSTREATWSARYGRNHLAAVNVRTQMQELKRAMSDEVSRIAEGYRSDYEISKAREESIRSSLASTIAVSQVTNQAQISLRELESNAKTTATLYDNFLQRYMEAIQQQSFPITEARMIGSAARPTGSTPSVPTVLAGSVVLGLLFSIGVAWLRDTWDRVFRSTEQVESALKTDCVAVLPLLASSEKSGASVEAAAAAAGVREFAGPYVLRYAVEAPFSRFTESIRHIKLAVDLAGVVKTNKIIGVTSTLPNEGKSTISANLAQLIAHAGSNVLLIDGDLKRPSLTHDLAPDASAGLIEVLSGATTLENAVWTHPASKLHFLPTVSSSRLAHTSEILGSDAMKKLLDRIREKYDYVVIDLSPVAPVVDVRSAAQFVDSFMYVIEWGSTSIETVERALATAPGVYERLVGCVLNKANMRVLARYENYYGNYYYNKYYRRYGYVK